VKVGVYWDLRSTVPERHTGVGKHVIQVLRHLARETDWEPCLLLARDQSPLWERQASSHGLGDLPAQVLPSTNKGFRLLHGIGPWPRLLSRLADYDLVYSPMELLLCTGTVPFVNTIHGVPCFERGLPPRLYRSRRYRYERLRQRWFFLRSRLQAARSLVVSHYLARRVGEISGFNRAKLPVIGNGVDDLFFENDGAAEALGANEPRLLVVGGANAFDGAPYVLRVARILAGGRPSVRIRIVGDRHEEPWFSQLHACANVEWAGFLDSRGVCLEMKRATALLYLPAVESFGIIGAEAMSLGLPILAHRSTGLPEVLGQAARWIDAETASDMELLRAVDQICGDEAVRRTLGHDGRLRARQYRWSEVGQRVDRVLREVVRAENG